MIQPVTDHQMLSDERLSEIRAAVGLPPVTSATSPADAILPLFDAVDLPYPPLDVPFQAAWLNEIIDRINQRA